MSLSDTIFSRLLRRSGLDKAAVDELVARTRGGSASAATDGAEYRAGEQAMPTVNGQFSWSLLPESLGELLDLTDPANPTVTAAGMYAVTVTAHTPNSHSSSYAGMALSCDDTGFGWFAEDTWPLDFGGFGGGGSASLVVYLPAGAVVTTYLKQSAGPDTPFTAFLAIHKVG